MRQLWSPRHNLFGNDCKEIFIIFNFGLQTASELFMNSKRIPVGKVASISAQICFLMITGGYNGGNLASSELISADGTVETGPGWQLCAIMMSWVGQWVKLVVYKQIKCYQINES